MELSELLESLETRLTGLLEENEILRLEAREAELLRVENQELKRDLETERNTRAQVESKISSILARLDEQLDEQPQGNDAPDQELN
ncbi:MAG TPA: hypothetical protein IAB01_06160 [Candidatus Avidesulfovibrio excrementigallinarum]|nr:hypothetical protein [Candidatus Avidesulfovibrio excrementigallinarum]